MKYVDNNLEYLGMYNWTNDLPNDCNARNDFLEMLNYFYDNFKTKNQTKILEIGTYCGVSLIHILKNIPNGRGYAIDKWQNYDECDLLETVDFNKVKEAFFKNIEVSGLKDRMEYLYIEESRLVLMDLLKRGNKFDLIYVDGSHKCLDAYLDLELSFELLNNKGMLIIDDVMYLKENILESPYEAVLHFLNKNNGKYKILKNNYRIFLEKL